MPNKICVYAICKNEIQFVEKWIESMSEADYIVVLDTGSTDGTYELLKNDKRVYRAEQKIIEPWRFDTARNESMKLVPKDANILFSTDLDELLEPGWADIIREKWIDGHHIRGDYKYAWSHAPDGQAARLFHYNKLHDRNWHWEAPVHEFLKSDLYTNDDLQRRTLDLFNEGVYLHHYPDLTRSRNNYLQLLELREKEITNEYYTKFYLAIEYQANKLYDKSNSYLNIILNTPKQGGNDNMEIAVAYFLLGRNHAALGDAEKAIYYYTKAIAQESSFREPYLFAAEICNNKQQYQLAIGYIKDAFVKSYRHYHWGECAEAWGSMAEVLLTVAYFYSGQPELALQYAEEALKKTPYDPQCQFNVDIIKKNLMAPRKV